MNKITGYKSKQFSYQESEGQIKGKIFPRKGTEIRFARLQVLSENSPPDTVLAQDYCLVHTCIKARPASAKAWMVSDSTARLVNRETIMIESTSTGFFFLLCCAGLFPNLQVCWMVTRNTRISVDTFTHVTD